MSFSTVQFSFVPEILTRGLLQEGPAETTGYFIAGYVVIFGVMALYLASLVIRSRNMHQDLETLDQVQEKRR